MKTVFTNAQCMHVYAQQSQEKGRTNNGNVFFENTQTIYSYGYHFPMCHILEDGKTALYNNDSYSISTSQQQADLRQAIRHYDILFVSTSFLKSFLYDCSFSKQTQETLVKGTLDKMVEHLNSAVKRRKQELKDSDINAALYELTNCETLFKHFGVKTPHKITSRIAMISTESEDVIARHKNYLAEQEAKKKREEAKKQRELLSKLEPWKAGEYEPMISRLNKTYLRIKGDNIETSKGAVFPVAHAKLAFKIIHKVMMNKETWQRNGKTIHLGHFQIDTIDASGNVTVGCHFVEYDEINEIAYKLGLV